MVAFANEPTPLFELGRVVATPGALKVLQAAGVDGSKFFARHQHGDYGDMCDDDRKANDAALKDGSRIFSSYNLPNGKKIWIITEAAGEDGKRASTCLLLPEEY